MTARQQLEALNEECDDFCRKRSNWVGRWRGTDEDGNPNFLLAYSSVETFKPGGTMILGTNPGGTHRHAHLYPASRPFDRDDPRWSSYLDDDWGNGLPGDDYVQRNVRKIAMIFAGGSDAGDELLRTSPTGNLIPFRSRTSGKKDLPEPVREQGLAIGAKIIAISQPSVLIWIASNATDWAWLMRTVGHREAADHTHSWRVPRRRSPYTFREASTNFNDVWPQLVFALPAMNSSSEDVRELHPKVLQHFEGRVEHHGLAPT